MKLWRSVKVIKQADRQSKAVIRMLVCCMLPGQRSAILNFWIPWQSW